MSVRERKERELAGTHGWDAVTTRRRAEQIEYSQPVLYGHFGGKRGIVGAVALEGFAEFTTALRAVVAEGPAGREAVAALARAYTDFAARNPALCDAMFRLDNGLPFADEATPAPLREAFQALLAPLVDHAHPEDGAVRRDVLGGAARTGHPPPRRPPVRRPAPRPPHPPGRPLRPPVRAIRLSPGGLVVAGHPPPVTCPRATPLVLRQPPLRSRRYQTSPSRQSQVRSESRSRVAAGVGRT